ncbi:ABC transporter permease [uncultured Clostridium sp.]|uniref:ABC transporter permease n=1 Tax=Lacrimispora sp. 38-1 TaxID=3125778 RepID=UPI0028D637BB|nr:ABC transporter permease [uncultured Clostridium sp.]
MKKFSVRLRAFTQYKDLLIQLVEKDIKLKYRRSFLGYLWSVLNPLMIMVIMVAVFQHMFRYTIENYPAYVISGQVCFNFLSESTNQAIWSITGNAALLKKTYVPKYIFTFAKVTSGCVNLLFSLGALLIVFIVCRVQLSVYMLLLPLVLIQLYVFCLGIGMFLAAINVFFRDIQYIYGAFLTAWMYMTPLFYPIEQLPDNVQWIVKHLNPLYFYVGQFRDIMIYQRLPGNTIMLAGIAAAMIAMIVGTMVFLKVKDNFILYI